MPVPLPKMGSWSKRHTAVLLRYSRCMAICPKAATPRHYCYTNVEASSEVMPATVLEYRTYPVRKESWQLHTRYQVPWYSDTGWSSCTRCSNQ